MKNAIKRFFALLLLLGILLCCGCGKAPENPNTVVFSQTKTNFRTMTKAEKAGYTAVEEILKNASLSYSNYSYHVHLKNDSALRLNLQVYALFYGEKDRIVGNFTLSPGVIYPGEEAKLPCYLHNELEAKQLWLAAQFDYEGVPIVVAPVFLCDLDRGDVSNITLTCRETFPLSVRLSYPYTGSVYTILDYKVVNDRLLWTVRKESGKENVFEVIHFRILDQNGVVWETSLESFHLVPGETARGENSLSDLPEGSYRIEFYG